MTLRSLRQGIAYAGGVGVRFAAIAVLAAGALMPSQMFAQRDPSPTGAPLPPPAEVSVQCMEGSTIQIPLRSSTRSSEQLKFLIRRGPSLGTLSEIEVTDRTNASVTYTHRSASGPGEDEFTYAIQAPDRPVSVASRVRISVETPPAVIVADRALEFGDVAIGTVVKKTARLKNTGGSAANIRLEATKPWSIEGKDSLLLPPGESGTFEVAFRPTDAIQYTTNIAYAGDPARQGLQVTGMGTVPFAFVTRETLLLHDMSAGRRIGTTRLANRTDEPIEVTLAASPHFEVAQRATLPAGGEVELPIAVEAAALGAQTGELTASSPTFSATTALKAPAAPPRVVMEPAGDVDFGQVSRGRLYRKSIQLRNLGGAPARLSALMPEGVSVLPEPEAFPLAPGETRAFEILFEPHSRFEGNESLRFGFGAHFLVIPLKATFSGESSPGVKPRASATPVPSPSPTSRPIAIPTGSMSGVPPIEQIGIVEATRRSIHIVWKNPSTDAHTFILEERRIEFTQQGRGGFIVWKRLPAKIEKIGDRVHARIENLKPGSTLLVRIVTEDFMGYLSAPSPTFSLQTEAPRRLQVPWWPFALAAVVALVVWIRRRRREQMRRLEEETDRIVRQV